MSDLARFLEMSLVGVRNAAYRQSLNGCHAEFRLAQNLRQLIGKMEVDFSDAIRRFESDLINGDIIMASRLEAYEAMFLSSHSPAVYRVGEPLFLELLDTGLQIVDLLIQAQSFEGCEIEADHIHNLARYAESADRADYRSYLEVERKVYVDRFATLSSNAQVAILHYRYFQTWRNLESTFSLKFQ